MPYIELEAHLPGITGLLEYRQDTAAPIRDLTELLLRGPSSLSAADRELIATVVSRGNDCTFCTNAHTATADAYLGESSTTQAVKLNISTAPISDKLKWLLTIADSTRAGGKSVTAEMIAQARSAAATDLEIHDTVLIAALFCLYNKYVDGLSTALPATENYYKNLADRLKNHGYTRLPQGYNHLKNQE